MKRALDTVKTLIIRCPNWVGDIVMATPTLDCLRQSFPQAKIIGLLRKKTQGIVKDGPWFDTMIDCHDKSWSAIWQTAKQIRQYTVDFAIVLPNSIRSAMPIRLGRAKEIYGYHRSFRGFLLSGGPKPVRSNNGILPLPMTEYYLEICRWLGLKTPQNVKPMLFIGEEIRKRGESLIRTYGIRENDMVIGLNPGASFGSSKCWPTEHFARLAELCEKSSVPKQCFLPAPAKKILPKLLSRKVTLTLLTPVETKLTWSCSSLLSGDATS